MGNCTECGGSEFHDKCPTSDLQRQYQALMKQTSQQNLRIIEMKNAMALNPDIVRLFDGAREDVRRAEDQFQVACNHLIRVTTELRKRDALPST